MLLMFKLNDQKGMKKKTLSLVFNEDSDSQVITLKRVGEGTDAIAFSLVQISLDVFNRP